MSRPRHRCSCRVHMAQVRASRERSARRWEENRARGMCGACGDFEPAGGKAECTDCLKVKSSKRARKAKGKNVFHRRVRGAA